MVPSGARPTFQPQAGPSDCVTKARPCPSLGLAWLYTVWTSPRVFTRSFWLLSPLSKSNRRGTSWWTSRSRTSPTRWTGCPCPPGLPSGTKVPRLKLPASCPTAPKSPLCPFPPARASGETVTVTMTMIRPALGTLGCRRESALRARDQGPLSTGCCALVHKVLKMSFPEMHLVAKAELSHQEAACHLSMGAARHVLLQDLRCL